VTNQVVRVFIPPALRRLTGCAEVGCHGSSVRAVIEDLEARFPGIRDRLCEGDRLKPGLSVVVGSTVAERSLLQPVPAGAEVHFLPAVGGG